jgi:tetratricopeptide (TPR) repeat protein
MRTHLALLAALASLTACATAGPPAAAPRPAAAPTASPPSPVGAAAYVAVSRAMTEIDAADRRGELGDELRWAEEAERAPGDAAAQFLAVAAQPGIDERWGGFRDLSRQLPGSPLPWVGMARTYVGWRTWDQAEKAVAGALQRDPRCWLAVRVRAELEEARGQAEPARADYQAVLAADPGNSEAHLGLARLARARGDAQEARAQASAAAEGPGNLPGAYRILAQLAEEAGDREAAVDSWRSAVAQDARDRDARVALARLLGTMGDQAAAAAEWQAALDLQEDPEALAALADAARVAGDVEQEQRALERLAQLRPSPEQWRRVAEVRLAARDAVGAERAYRRVLEARPRDEQASLGLGRILEARGDATGAVELLRAAGEPGREERAALEKRLHLEKLSRPDLAALQKAVQALVDRTYRDRLASSPSLSGNLRVRVAVDGDGAPTTVEVLEDSVHDGDVRACAYWNLRDATYPPGQPGRYSFAFTFRR